MQGFTSQEKPWGAPGGLACAAGLIIFSLAINEGLRIGSDQSAAFTDWLRQHSIFVQGSLMLFQAALWLLLAFGFSRAESVRCFAEVAGLGLRPGVLGWLVASAAIGIGLFDLYGASKGWTSSNRRTLAFYSSGATARWFFVVHAVLIVPFYEEVVMRGFLYRAFRGGYGLVSSTVMILSTQTFFHWGGCITFSSRLCLPFFIVDSSLRHPRIDWKPLELYISSHSVQRDGESGMAGLRSRNGLRFAVF